MRGRRRPREEWEARVAAWRSSGLTQQRFADRKGIPASTLSWWSCRLRRERTRGGARLLPVRVVGAAPPGGGDFRVELARGRTLQVPAAFDDSALRRLSAVLEGETC